MNEASDARSAEPARMSGRGGKAASIPGKLRDWAARLAAGLHEAVAGALNTRRLYVLWPFLIIAGLISYCLLPSEPNHTVIFAALACLSAGIFFSRNSMSMLRISFMLTGFWLGLCLLPFHGQIFGTGMLDWPVFGTYQARVDTVLRSSPDSSSVVVSAIEPLDDASGPSIRRARLFIRQDVPLAPGDMITGRMRFAPVPGPVTPGGFDSQFHGYFDGIGAFGNTLSEITVHPADAPGFRHFTNGIRREIARRIDAVLSQPASGIARALTIGDQSLIADETRETMAAAGLAHVLAISGLHLTLVAGGVFFVVRATLALSYRAGQIWPVKKLAAGAGIAIAIIYLVLSGASVSATRATIMLILVFGAVIAGRRALTMRNVALAALFILLTDPASIFRAGFQLSFGAVVALIGAYEMTRNIDRENGWFPRLAGYFKGLIATSAIAGAATALFAAYHFQQTAPLGVIGNILALPFVGFAVLPSAVFAVLSMPFGIEPAFLHVMGWAIDRILSIADMVAGWSQGLHASPLLMPSALIFAAAGFAWFAFFRNSYRFAGPVAALVLTGTIGLAKPPDVLVADTTKAVAVRDEEGLALISGRTGSFATDVWSETYQEPVRQDFPGLTCDAAACIAHSPRGFVVSLVEQPHAFWEDCHAVDLVVTRLYAPLACRSVTTVIDRSDLDTYGVQWLRWDAVTSTFDRRTAITDPDRPWRP